jgi:xanthine dehydrogenase accessory factor
MVAIASSCKPEAKAQEAIEAARAWLDELSRIALATVVRTWGSSPVPVGGQLAVASDERFEGSVSGGCIEAEVIFEAMDVISTGRPKLLEFGITNETAWRAGLPCGGRIEIYVEALVAGRDGAYLDAVLEARATRSPLVVRTALSNGSRELFDARATLTGDVADCLKSGQSRIVDAPEGRAFLHALTPAVHVIIVGATHIGQLLSDLVRRIGWNVSIVDPRSAFATEDRFGGIARHTEWPEASLKALTLDRHTAVVALTHVGQIDDEALVAALGSRCFYVGALGSQRNHAGRVERLRTAGLKEADIARIRAPIGLAIGAKGPEEIAVAILAEIVKDRRGA